MFNSFGSLSNVIEITLLTQKIVAIILTIFINFHILNFSPLCIFGAMVTSQVLSACGV